MDIPNSNHDSETQNLYTPEEQASIEELHRLLDEGLESEKQGGGMEARKFFKLLQERYPYLKSDSQSNTSEDTGK